MSEEELFECLKKLSKTNNLRDGVDIKKEEANIIVNEIERLNNIIDKAIEYIKEYGDITAMFIPTNIRYETAKELLEILDKGE